MTMSLRNLIFWCFLCNSAACTNPNKTEKNFVSLSGSVDKVNECSLELQDSMEVADKAKNPLYFKEMK